MRALLFAAVLVAGCATAVPPTPPTPPAAGLPTSVGACDPSEYFVQHRTPAQAHFRVVIDGQGRAFAVKLTRSFGLEQELMAPALDIARHVFRCRNRLAPDAPRVIEDYVLHFAPVDGALVDAARCGHDVSYPERALQHGLEALVHIGVTLDETGRVEQA